MFYYDVDKTTSQWLPFQMYTVPLTKSGFTDVSALSWADMNDDFLVQTHKVWVVAAWKL